MKAVIYTKSGPPGVLKIKELEKPLPAGNEILVKVRAGTVTIGDVLLRKLSRLILFPLELIFGFKKKIVVGIEFAGVVEAVGEKVTRFEQGDEVFGTTTGLSLGGNAEYLCLPEEWKDGVVTKKPAGVSFEEAAALPVGGMTALYNFKKTSIEKGGKVLIYGASGSVGSYALQLAKYFGAEVTAVCSGANLEMVRSLGADEVIDYTKEDFAGKGVVYDVIFDAVGKISKSRCKGILKPGGTYLTVKLPTKENLENLDFLKGLLAEGKIKAFIDKRFPLEEIVEAHRYVESGRKRGNVVINVSGKY